MDPIFAAYTMGTGDRQIKWMHCPQTPIATDPRCNTMVMSIDARWKQQVWVDTAMNKPDTGYWWI
jgi:hypothetical protein